MNDLLDIEIILKRKEYSKIYNLGIIILVIILIFIGLLWIYDYRTYLMVDGRVIENEIELLISKDNIRYVVNNDCLMINNKKYKYKITEISDEVIYGIDKQIYQYVYIDILDILKINNYIYQINFFKEKKKLIKYLVDYL